MRADAEPGRRDGRMGWRRGMRSRRFRRAVTAGLPVGRASVVVAAIEDSPTAVPVARWAGDVARATGGEIVVFVAQPVLPEIHGPAGMGWLDETEAVEQGAAATVGRVRPTLERTGVPFRIEVRPCLARRWAAARTRQAAKALLRAARDVGADLIVIGHRPARRHMRSSVAARVVQRAGCDVLVVPLGLPPADVDEERRPDAGERLAS